MNPEPDADRSMTIRRGTCHHFFAFDIGITLNLTRCLSLMALRDDCTVTDRYRRAPRYFGFDPQPLAVIQKVPPIQLGGFTAQPSISLTFYDFGAVSIGYRIPFKGTLHALAGLSMEIDSNEALLTDAQARIRSLMGLLTPAIDGPHLARLSEDYAIFEIYDFAIDFAPAHLAAELGLTLTQILRAEQQTLSEQETNDAMLYRIAYSSEDLTLIDWNASIIIGQQAEDIRAVLEFANVELLEMRLLDGQLDEAIEESYNLTYKIPRLLRYLPGSTARILRRISRMQLESAVLLERVSNAPKLLGDQFLARIYRLAALRFHLAEWNATIQRKLETIENFYEQIHDGTVGLRMEILEWIIIILIALEIVISFIPGLRH